MISFRRDINKAYMGEKLEKESYTGFDAALDEEQQMKEGKYKKAEKYYDSILKELKRNPSLCQT